MTAAPPRRPSSGRNALVALTALGVLHAAIAPRLEAWRIDALATVVRAVSFAVDDADAVSFDDPGAPRGDSPPTIGRDARTLVADFDPEAGVLILGAGRDAGVKFGAPVSAAEGLLGHVDRVEAHLSRARLLTARGARLAVTLKTPRPGLPGGIRALNAVMEGDGDGAALVQGALLDHFRRGDLLVAAGGETPVGEVIEEGPRPRVRVHASAGDVAWVTVGGLDESAAPTPLFEDEELTLLAASAGVGGVALLGGRALGEVPPGSVIHTGGRYVGRIERRGAAAAVASRLSDRGHVVVVRWTAPGAEGRVELRSMGDGRVELRGVGVPAAPVAEIELRTAGGRGITPPGLFVGRAVRDGAAWRLSAAPSTPARLSAAAFLFDDERRRLSGARAR